ncbi:glycosyltransferase family 2 protein [Nonomuraea sp. NPDC050153]|uniref:glycosyltransferase family 2 protein n=1 Tax=Nonomuraea sp. NPDC050153 TaxID=3364359 RepID=UPI0037981069
MRFSVVCPTYNRGPAITATVDSVVAQSLRDWELLVVSDGSDDDTDRVVAESARADRRVRLIRTHRHGHPSQPRNLGLAEARGEFVAYLDHDDRWAPQHLAVLARALEGGERFAATGATRVDAAGTVLHVTPPLALCWHPELQLMNAIFQPSQVAHVAGLAEQVGGWRRSESGLEDWDLWLRLADAGVRCRTAADPTVIELVDPATRQSSLVARHGWEVARFPDGRAARAAYRALKDTRRVRAAREALEQDLRAWYADLAELVIPSGWEAGPPEVDRALAETVAEASIGGRELWPDLAIVPRDGHVALVHLISCVTQDHADRIGALTRRVMRHQMALYEDVLGGA